jgi:hypothetical protein
MNSLRSAMVEPMIRGRTAPLVCALVIAAGCSACVDINGGAVELRWEIRKADGAKTDCTDTQLARVQLCATPDDGGAPYCEDWACVDYQGSTDFAIRPGRYSLAIQPLCAGGETPSASVPAPILRDITNGYVATLNTLLIVKVGTGFICPTP